MPEPATIIDSMTLEQLLTELAVRARWADYSSTGKPIPPADPARLASLMSAVNLGYTAFLAANPRWTFLERVVVLTLSPDGTAPECIENKSWRYRLPDYVKGDPKSDWAFIDDMACVDNMVTVSRTHIDAMHGATNEQGTPRYASVTAAALDRREFDQSVVYELVVFPRPDRAYVVEGLFRITPSELRGMGDKHIAGYEHNNTLLEFCDYQRQRADGLEPADPTLSPTLARSIKLDDSKRPRTVGRRDRRRFPPRRRFNWGGIPIE